MLLAGKKKMVEISWQLLMAGGMHIQNAVRQSTYQRPFSLNESCSRVSSVRLNSRSVLR